MFRVTEHWHALLSWLDALYSCRDLIADAPVPSDTDLQTTLTIITKGRERLCELREIAVCV